MPILRAEHSSGFTVIDNTALRDPRLSLNAIALLVRVLSLPDNWSFSKSGLVSICREGKSAVGAAIAELKRCGYLEIVRHDPTVGSGGRVSYEYVFREIPLQRPDFQVTVFQDAVSQAPEFQQSENLPQLINHIPSNYLSSTKKDSTSPAAPERVDYQPIIELFNSLCPSLPKVRSMTDARRKALRARLAEAGEDGLREVFTAVEESDFLSGRSGAWNGCGFDWILKPANFVKIREGNYMNNDVNGGRDDLRTTHSASAWDGFIGDDGVV